ncbi:MAG TPA: MdtA/MuxA family multidrug efflux RND transporter periplasmic adaptor subunit [Candidatus Acidoferrales bacterium]|nr:MdtA/MuxA family multidrug efflux RND transporter periplasmic adaptor subunit [Candidatus Acidoferrales bacterium]
MSSSEISNVGGGVPGDPIKGNGVERSHRWVWILAIVLIAAGGTAYEIHSRSQAASKDPAAPQPVSVGVTSVQKMDVPFYLTGLGSVTAFNTVTVHSRVDGQIVKVHFTEGQFVHAGDVLAEIDPRPFQVALDQAEGQLAKDIASQNDAKADLNRYQQLWQAGVIARQQLDSQQATVGQFDGAIQSDKAQIDNQKLQLNYCRITSPIDGRVGLRLVDSGNIVHASDSNGMLVITQVRPVAVVFTLPEDSLPQVVAEMKQRQLSVETYGRDNNTKLADGKLLTIDNEIDQTTGTIKLKSQFDNRDMSLWPNQFVNVRLFLNVRKGAIVVPTAAIQSGAQGPFVYVVGSNDEVQARSIQEDFSEGNISVIRQGLKEGEEVVVDGQDKLQGGAIVSPQDSSNRGRAQSGEAPQGLHP